MSQIIQEAQDRLLKKRENLGETETLTPLMPSSDDLMGLLPECQHGNKVGFCDECKEEKRIAEEEWKSEGKFEAEKKEAEKEEVEKLEWEKERREHPEKYMNRAIPKKFLDRSLDNFKGSEPVKKLCLEYANGFIKKTTCLRGRPLMDDGLVGYPGSVLFTGKPGCGKTHLAIAIVRELKKRMPVQVLFTTAPELLLEIRATFRPSAGKYDDHGICEADTENDILDKYSQCELLILDDLGAEKVSDFTIQSLYLVIDRRNRDLRPTIVTTNLSLEEIETEIDARMASRLADMKIVKLTMPDYRKLRAIKPD